jgi:hypothetical protein
MRDKGWMETDLILKLGIQHGLALEVGPGPGYLGLEWLKKMGVRQRGRAGNAFSQHYPLGKSAKCASARSGTPIIAPTKPSEER